MNQKERILNSNATEHEMSDRTYKGETPKYKGVTNPYTKVVTWHKVAKGVPFVRKPVSI